jgi:hypothetical protein
MTERMQMGVDAEKPPETGATRSDRIYTGIAVLAVLLAAWFAFQGGKGDTTQVRRSALIRIEDPRNGGVLAQPVALILDIREPLRPNGSDTSGTRHVHVDVGSRMLMPGPADLQPLPGGMYRWTLPVLPAGEAEIRAYWSDAAHRRITGAPADSVRVRLR